MMKIPDLSSIDYGIIDAHMHPYLSSSRPTHPFHMPDDYDEFFAEQRRAGISISCGSFNIYNDGTDFEVIRQCNDTVMAVHKAYPDEYLPGINVHPNFPEESCREIARLHGQGCRVVGEIAGYVMGYDTYATPGMFQIIEEAQSRDMLLSFHPTNLEDIAALAENFPRAKLMMAHPGGMRGVMRNYELMEKYSNIYWDLSGTGLLRWGMLRKGIDMLGADRFLFGTDFPVCNSGMNVFGVLYEHLTYEEQRKIFRSNFVDLTGYPIPR